MKKQTKLKAFVLSVMMLAGMLLPASAFAQSDAYFRDNDDYSNRNDGAYNLNNQQFGSDDNGGYNLNNQTFGQDPAPLGTGLLIFTAAGAGYVALKRKRS